MGGTDRETIKDMQQKERHRQRDRKTKENKGTET